MKALIPDATTIPEYKSLLTKLDSKDATKLKGIYRVKQLNAVVTMGIKDLIEIIEASGNLHPQVIVDRLRNMHVDSKVA